MQLTIYNALTNNLLVDGTGLQIHVRHSSHRLLAYEKDKGLPFGRYERLLFEILNV